MLVDCAHYVRGIRQEQGPMTLERAAAWSDCAVMVGDSSNDVDMARAAGIPVIAVDFGYTEVPAGELNADLVISGFGDLPKAVFGLLERRGEVST